MNIIKGEPNITNFYAVIWCRSDPKNGEENGVFEEIFKDEKTAYDAMMSDFEFELSDFKEKNDGREDSLNIAKGKDYARIFDNLEDSYSHFVRWEIIKVFCEND